VIEWARAHIANYKVPRRVELVDELPLNASGKVLKGELRARASTERTP
jgi:acyl-CoA synthetase (AMP-forming)/AMP-acid ligase II